MECRAHSEALRQPDAKIEIRRPKEIHIHASIFPELESKCRIFRLSHFELPSAFGPSAFGLSERAHFGQKRRFTLPCPLASSNTMTTGSLSNYFFLFKTFRNWFVLIQNLRHGGYLDGGPLRERLVFWDGRMVVHPPDRRGLAAILLEIWHNNVYRLGHFYSPRPGDVIADIGAHVGLFSLRVLREAPFCRVVALEPSRENFECLRQNVSEFLRTGRMEIHNVAIGQDFGKITMMEIPSNRSFDARTQPALPTDKAAVDMVPLSRVLELARTDELALLKMDAEGGEEGAFGAAGSEVIRRIQRIAMEYHDHLVPGTLSLLRRRLSPTHDLTIFPDTCGVHGHLFAVRKDLVFHNTATAPQKLPSVALPRACSANSFNRSAPPHKSAGSVSMHQDRATNYPIQSP